MNLCLQLFFVLLNVIVNHDIVFKLIGRVNRRKRRLRAVFVTYPNTEKIAARFAPRWLWGRLKWQPYLIGIFEQGGEWGLKFVISSLPHEIYTSENKDNRKKLLDEMERLRRLVGAEKILFGFALSSALRNDRWRDDQGGLKVSTDDALIAAQAAVLAVGEVRRQNRLDGVPVIFLASQAMLKRIGSCLKVAQGADEEDYESLMINPQDCGKPEFVWPETWRDYRVIVISLAKEEELLALRERFGPLWIIVNEAYLRDPDDFVRQLSRPKGVPVYQLCGAKGRTIPDPPGTIYHNSMPCCQVINPANMEVVVREIRSC
jgi:hypothetical protein